jgi:hypothetical protein
VIGAPRVARAVVCLLAGELLLGLAHVAALPPWEGFDEPAHYSYLQQLADRGELPRLPAARMGRDVERYSRVAPLPYSSVPPFEQNGGLTYQAFFAGFDGTMSGPRPFAHQPPREARHYVAGSGDNWEAQHPPLYYLVLAPVYVATRHLSWSLHLGALRLASYLLAWTALVVGAYACATTAPALFGGGRAAPQWAMLGIATWPILLPSWFPEMARLGNDSLTALLLAGTWLVVARALGTGLSLPRALALGALLGLGCLTKAFFVPISVGLLGFGLVRAWPLRKRRVLVATALRLAVVVLVAVGIAGWWYVENWRRYGVILGPAQMIAAHRVGGVVHGLAERFSIMTWLRGHAAFVASLGWSCTWSLARPPYPYFGPMVGIVLLAAGAYAAALRRFRAGTLAWLPGWLLAPVALGFSYYILVRMALRGEGRGTSGYYLHVLAGALGVALGLGIGAWWGHGGFRRLTAGLTVYAVLFGVAISWAQVLLFSGWLVKSGADPFYRAPAPLPPWLGVPDALARLAVLAHARLAATAWVVGGGLVLVGLASAWKAAHALERAGA